MGGVFLIGTIVFLIPGLDTASGEPTSLSAWVRLVAGVILLLLAVRQWRRRPSADDPVEAPKVLSKLKSISAAKTLVMGLLVSSLNPKNLLLTDAGAATIDASMATPLQQAIALIVYAIVASSSVLYRIAPTNKV
jgi:threonine/homoserine/homoserine lactone efflux protein